MCGLCGDTVDVALRLECTACWTQNDYDLSHFELQLERGVSAAAILKAVSIALGGTLRFNLGLDSVFRVKLASSLQSELISYPIYGLPGFTVAGVTLELGLFFKLFADLEVEVGANGRIKTGMDVDLDYLFEDSFPGNILKNPTLETRRFDRHTSDVDVSGHLHLRFGLSPRAVWLARLGVRLFKPVRVCCVHDCPGISLFLLFVCFLCVCCSVFRSC
eukprot:m.223713 g.223713  ORF g.223713 m.223713 type:complete len:218 (-) comp18757_c1_seq6:65-718(-)